MASPGQKRGYGHLMVGSDTHSFCPRCRDKCKDPDPFGEKSESNDCNFCNILTPEQCSQLSTPSYKIKKERCESKNTAKNLKTPLVPPLWSR